MLDVKRNLTTMTDFYELTMSAGYLDEGYVDKIAVFDMFLRRVPDGGGYAIMAGLQQFMQPRWRIAKETSGVGRKSSKR